MPSLAPDPVALWDIAVPTGRRTVPGVTMAGFAHRPTVGPVDLRPLPHPAVTLVLDLGVEPIAVDDDGGARHRGSQVIGLTPGAVRAHGSGLGCIQVRLPPLAAAGVLGASAAELDGAVVELEQLWGADARRLEERLRAAASWDERFALVDAELGRRHEVAAAPAPEITHAWRQIVGSRGQVSVDDLTAAIGWSRKRTWSRFRSLVGIGPKRAAMLARFDHAAHLLAAGAGAARVAAEGGYADQSHLHREVQTFAGTTPTDVARAPWLAVDDIAWPDR